MNSEFEQRKSLQELKQMNQPNTEQPPTPVTPIVIQCPLPEALTKLAQQANKMCWELQTTREYLPDLKSRTDLTAVQSSLSEIQNSLTKLISLVEQAGKPKEKRFFSAQGQTSEVALISDAAFCPANPVGVVGGVVRFGHALECAQNTAPIIDSTTRQFTDGKALRREKQKKIAHGQKADDHENKPTWEQTL